jgi:hypothetical protein
MIRKDEPMTCHYDPDADPGLLATVTTAEMDALAERERANCLQFAAWWRQGPQTTFSIQSAEHNEARAARLAAILGRTRDTAKPAA